MRTRQLIMVAPITIGALLVIAFVYVAIARMAYPFELEWMEGGVAAHVDRVLRGEPIYQRPSLTFAAFLYTPLYYWVGAAATSVMGEGFTALRLLSFAATLGSMVTIFALVRRETNSSIAAWIGSCTFAATFDMTGGWFDLARNDSLFLLLVLSSLWLVRGRDKLPWAIVAGTLMTLAVLTKQVGLVVAAGMSVAAFTRGNRFGLTFVATTALATAGAVLWLQSISDGWFLFYTWQVPGQHALIPTAFTGFWIDDIAPSLPIAILLSGAAPLLLWRTQRRAAAFWLAAGGGLIAAAWSGRMHDGTYLNNLIPAAAALAILMPIGMHTIITTAATRWPRRQTTTSAAVATACVVQFGLLAYSPADHLPSAADAAAGDALVAELRTIDGDVLIPAHGYLARRAGMPGCAHRMAIVDLLKGGATDETEVLLDELDAALTHHRYRAVLLDEASFGRAGELERNYDLTGEWSYADNEVFRPVTGLATRPRWHWSPTAKSLPAQAAPPRR